MKIALSNEGGFIAQHFGRAASFTVVELEDDKIKDQKVIDNTAHLKGSLPEMLRDENIDVVITGGMGMGAKNFLKDFGINYITGASGRVDDVLEQYISGDLKSIEVECDPKSGHGCD